MPHLLWNNAMGRSDIHYNLAGRRISRTKTHTEGNSAADRPGDTQMATIVAHRQSGQRFIVIGSGFTAFTEMKPKWFTYRTQPADMTGQMTLIACCGPDGSIGWFWSQELVVVEVDGVSPAQALGAAG
jgi:hypothetical protein